MNTHHGIKIPLTSNKRDATLSASCPVDGCKWSVSGPVRAEAGLQGEIRLHLAARTAPDGDARLCRSCNTPLIKKPGPGRWPVLCPDCKENK